MSSTDSVERKSASYGQPSGVKLAWTVSRIRDCSPRNHILRGAKRRKVVLLACLSPLSSGKSRLSWHSAYKSGWSELVSSVVATHIADLPIASPAPSALRAIELVFVVFAACKAHLDDECCCQYALKVQELQSLCSELYALFRNATELCCFSFSPQLTAHASSLDHIQTTHHLGVLGPAFLSDGSCKKMLIKRTSHHTSSKVTRGDLTHLMHDPSFCVPTRLYNCPGLPLQLQQKKSWHTRVKPTRTTHQELRSQLKCCDRLFSTAEPWVS